MQPRQKHDPWYTALYRDPQTLWWAPGLVVAVALLLMNLLVFERSVVHAVTVAALIGGSANLGTYYRWRGRIHHQ